MRNHRPRTQTSKRFLWDDNRGAMDITVDRGGNLLYNFMSSRIRRLNGSRVGLLVHASDRRG